MADHTEQHSMPPWNPEQPEAGDPEEERIAAKLDHDREWLGKLYRADAERQYLAVVIANMAEAARHLRARLATPEPADG